MSSTKAIVYMKLKKEFDYCYQQAIKYKGKDREKFTIWKTKTEEIFKVMDNLKKELQKGKK